MSLNIKNEEAHHLAQQIAGLTGETLTAAVTSALRERLQRLHQPAIADLAQRLAIIGQDCAAHLSQDALTIDHGALLYDEQGLPR